MVDFWALGVVLFELLTLQRPFGATNLLALVSQLTSGNPQSDQILRASPHPEELKRLVTRDALLDPNPATRLALPKIVSAYPCEP